jgi:hypothetical protein
MSTVRLLADCVDGGGAHPAKTPMNTATDRILQISFAKGVVMSFNRLWLELKFPKNYKLFRALSSIMARSRTSYAIILLCMKYASM